MTAIALKVDYPTLPSPASAFVDFLAALTDLEQTVRERVKAAEKALDKAESGLHTSIKRLQDTIALGEKATAAGVSLDADEIVAMAERAERQIAVEAEKVDQTIRRVDRLLRKAIPQHAKHVRPLMERYYQTEEWYLSELQECRWRIMALRADQHGDERGPVFSNPRDLARHLGSLAE